MGRIGLLISKALAGPGAGELTEEYVRSHECATGIDVGCGAQSPLGALRPRLETVGVDSSQTSLEQSKHLNLHDHYVIADILTSDVAALLPPTWGGKADVVGLYGVIEHLPKRLGYDLLERCEAISRKLVLVETPNGFQPQGPEHGNEHMRHLSGWFIEDFVGRGYEVLGSTGTKYLRGYGAGLKFPYRGVGTLDVVLSRILRTRHAARHAFNLFAVKDVRGVKARFG